MRRKPVVDLVDFEPLTQNSNMPPVDALRAHVQLARISDHIVCETFKVAPRHRELTSLAEEIGKATHKLHDWANQLPPALGLFTADYAKDPACRSLHMAYNQVRMTTHIERMALADMASFSC